MAVAEGKRKGAMKGKINGKIISFTPPGLAVFLISFFLLARSLSAGNPYEILLSSGALALLALLYGAGAFALRRLAALEPVWKPSVPLAASSAAEWPVAVQAAKVPRFFRLHFRVRGRFFPQGAREGCSVFAETSFSRKGDAAGLNLMFPLGGLFQGEGSLSLRDVFGFFSFPCGEKRAQSFNVRSAPASSKPLRIDAQSGAEDRRNKTSSDEERYYMREYAPGDRFRDINWKSSERIDALITRISPDNQEKVTRIEVFFRNCGPLKASIGDLWLLDRAKARLAWFLRAVKEEKASYMFHVQSAGKDWELKEEGDIDSFIEELSVLPFYPASNKDPFFETGGTGELYVFSTACDTGLPGFISAQLRPVTLFLAQNPPEKNAAGSDLLRLRDFAACGSFPLPRWLFSKGSKGCPFNQRAITDYAEACL
ncbi:MAG: DUF58 domain-containing protein [Treponema sp.]|nr:DUF58 domain-containing protein [Treponema sp.]